LLRTDRDVVNDLLASVRVRTTVYCRSAMRAPWGFEVEAHRNPSFHVVRGVDGNPSPWVAATLGLLAETTSSDALGAEAVVARLAETIVMQTLRSALAEKSSVGSVQIGALRDPQIAAAIRLIHEEPGFEWTVERLASRVGYSRSAFASRFRELVGESPIAYLTRSRLAIAATLLDRTKMSIGEVARRTGYANEASFGRAFSRAFGVAPGTYRRKAPAAASVSTADVVGLSAPPSA
jgi:AraC-like DNA-binding protein